MKIIFGICKSDVKKFVDGEKVFCGTPTSPFNILIETDFDNIITGTVKNSSLQQVVLVRERTGKTIVHFGVRKLYVSSFQSGKAVLCENPFCGHTDFTADIKELEFTETSVRRILA